MNKSNFEKFKSCDDVKAWFTPGSVRMDFVGLHTNPSHMLKTPALLQKFHESLCAEEMTLEELRECLKSMLQEK